MKANAPRAGGRRVPVRRVAVRPISLIVLCAVAAVLAQSIDFAFAGQAQQPAERAVSQDRPRAVDRSPGHTGVLVRSDIKSHESHEHAFPQGQIDNEPPVLYNKAVAVRVLRALAQRRCAYVVFGDSNTIFGIASPQGSGHLPAMSRHLESEYGLHGTGLFPLTRTSSNHGSHFNGWASATNSFSAGTPIETSPETIPAGLLAFCPQLGVGSLGGRISGLADEEGPPSNTPFAVFSFSRPEIDPVPPLVDIDQAMRYHMRMGRYLEADASEGNPKFRLRMDHGVTSVAQTVFESGDLLHEDTYGIIKQTLDIPAGSRSTGSNYFGMRFWTHGSALSQFEGPFLGFWQQFEFVGQLTGPAVTSIQHATNIKTIMQNLLAGNDQGAEHFFEAMTDTLQGENRKTLVVDVRLLGHDVNDASPSWGGDDWDGPAGRTKEGFANNLRLLIDYVTARAKAGGFEDVYFLHNYHPKPNLLEAHAALEEGALLLIDEGYPLAVIRGTELVTPEEIVANGWFASSIDTAHFKPIGYNGYNLLVFDAYHDVQTSTSCIDASGYIAGADERKPMFSFEPAAPFEQLQVEVDRNAHVLQIVLYESSFPSDTIVIKLPGHVDGADAPTKADLAIQLLEDNRLSQVVIYDDGTSLHEMLTADVLEAQQSSPHGELSEQGYLFSTNSCPRSVGVCCINGVAMTVRTSETDCLAADGAYMGDFTDPEEVACPPTCMGDLTGSGEVNGFDLLALLSCWGPVTPECEPGDFTGEKGEPDGVVNGLDLLELLSNWGPCQ